MVRTFSLPLTLRTLLILRTSECLNICVMLDLQEDDSFVLMTVLHHEFDLNLSLKLSILLSHLAVERIS